MFPPLQTFEKFMKKRFDFLRWDQIHNIFKLGRFRNWFDVEYCLQIVAMLEMLKPSLEFEHGRVLEKHHRKGTHAAVVKAVIHLPVLTSIFERMKMLWHGLSQAAETQMFFCMQVCHPLVFFSSKWVLHIFTKKSRQKLSIILICYCFFARTGMIKQKSKIRFWLYEIFFKSWPPHVHFQWLICSAGIADIFSNLAIIIDFLNLP